MAPPLQPGPARLPERIPLEARPQQPEPVFEEPSFGEPIPQPQAEPGDQEQPPAELPNITWRPQIQGTTPYNATQLQQILRNCGRPSVPATLRACAAALTARLTSDGYINSRVYTLLEPPPAHLEVVEGRIAEVRVSSTDQGLQQEVSARLQPLVGNVLHLASLEQALVSVRSLPGVGQIKGSLGRLGSDATQAVLNLTIDAIAAPWHGEISIRNDGNDGTGPWRGVATVLKNNLLKRNDIFLAYLELNADSDPELGSTITSTSYTFPLSDSWFLTGSFGYSKRQLIEFADEAHDLSFRQFQVLGQIEKTLHRSPWQEWSAFAGISGNRNDSYLGNRSIPLIIGGGPEGWLRSGYLRAGVNFSGNHQDLAWGGNIYGLQGIAGFSTETQLKDLALYGVHPGDSRALGGLANLAWRITPKLGLNLRAGGQIAFSELTNSMGFSLGSDVGLRGLPGTLISGDSGWLSTGELVVNVWQKENQSVQIVPFLGIGGIRTDVENFVFTDTVGSGGLLARYINEGWMMELGWVDSFQTDDNLGLWQDWLIGNGVYAKVRYRF